MRVGRWGERLGLMSKYDCVGKRTGKEAPNVCVLVTESPENMTREMDKQQTGVETGKDGCLQDGRDIRIDVNA